MANAPTIKYIYPANHQDGANPVPTRRVVVQLTNFSDGSTGETDVVKIRLSDLMKHDGTTPTRTMIERIQYSIYDLVVRLEWDRAPNAQIALLGTADTAVSGDLSWPRYGGLVDPGEEGDRTGNIILTIVTDVASGTYDITLTVKLK